MTDSITVYSIFAKYKKYFEKNINIKNFESNVSMTQFSRLKPYTLARCRKVAREINNCHYTLDDYKNYLMYLCLFNKKLSWKQINSENVKLTANLFTRKQFELDKKFIIELNKKVKLESIEEYYQINSDGNNFLFNLILDRSISPIFYYKMFVKTKSKKYEESDNLKLFNATINKIKKINKENAECQLKEKK